MTTTPIIYHPAPLRFRFPQGWHITFQVADETWWASKDTRMLTCRTEGGLYALVMDSERRRALVDL
jgi:hypothetical protein